MAQKLEKEELIDVVLDGFEVAGWKTQRGRKHPFRVLVDVPGGQELLMVHIWNITHGGRTRAAHEYRIQITGIEEKLTFKERYKTLLLGVARLDDVNAVVVAFDPDEHTRFGRSPSIQVREETLRQALERGVAVEEKTLTGGHAEMAIAFRPDIASKYLTELYPQYHAPGTTTPAPEGEKVATLNFAKADLSDEDLSGIPAKRRKALRTTAAWARERNFRRDVLHVYDYGCAICGVQLNLVEGAHIVAVHEEGSTDDVRNGLSLCFLHHGAYDRGLIVVGPDYKILVNKTMVHYLRKGGQAAGINDFVKSSRIGEKIYVPTEEKYQPAPDRLKENLQAMQARGFKYVTLR